MKKLIVLSVIFALVVGSVFAVDIGGTVIGTVNVIQGDTGKDANDDANPITSSGEMNRIRIDGSGEVADGVFGGYVRVEGTNTNKTRGDITGHGWEGDPLNLFRGYGNAWWKPIDQFKLLIGSNGGDGFYGKEGVTAWMFYQTVSDTGVVNPGNAWGGGYGGAVFRDAFFGGDDGLNALRLEINPLDVLGININLPVFGGGETADIFKKLIAQVNVNLDFGTIALTYRGALGYDEDKGIDDPSTIYVYFGGNFGDLSLDVGLSAKFGGNPDVALPIGVGLGLKYATDAFGVKFRVVATLAGDDKNTNIVADILPYFPLSDKLTVFVSAGLAMLMPDEGDSVTGWHFNPYLQVGEEWGAKFLAGIKVFSDGAGDDPVINWSVPIAIVVSF